MKKIEENKKFATDWFKSLRNKINIANQIMGEDIKDWI